MNSQTSWSCRATTGDGNIKTFELFLGSVVPSSHTLIVLQNISHLLCPVKSTEWLEAQVNQQISVAMKATSNAGQFPTDTGLFIGSLETILHEANEYLPYHYI